MLVVYYRAAGCTFYAQAQKIKKIPSEKKFVYFGKWNSLALISKQFLLKFLLKQFSKKKLFLYYLKKKAVLIF